MTPPFAVALDIACCVVLSLAPQTFEHTSDQSVPDVFSWCLVQPEASVFAALLNERATKRLPFVGAAPNVTARPLVACATCTTVGIVPAGYPVLPLPLPPVMLVMRPLASTVMLAKV